jgi:hypothetical protein
MLKYFSLMRSNCIFGVWQFTVEILPLSSKAPHITYSEDKGLHDLVIAHLNTVHQFIKECRTKYNYLTQTFQ